MKTKYMKMYLQGILSMVLAITATACGNGTSEGIPGRTLIRNLEAPFNLSAQAISTNAIELTWSNPSISGSYQIGIEKKQANNSSATFQPLAMLNQSQNYTAVGLVPNTAYEFRVFVSNNSSQSEYAVATAVTFNVIGAPDPVTNLSATLTQNTPPYEVTLSWNHNLSSSVDYYLVTKRENSSNNTAAVQYISNTSFTSLIDNTSNSYFMYSGSYLGFQSNTAYYYEVQACIVGACSAAQNITQAIPGVGTQKPHITSFTASDNQSDKVVVDWAFDIPINNTVSSITVTRGSGGQPLFFWNGSGNILTQVTDNNTVNGTIYTYKIKMVYTDNSFEELIDDGQSVANSTQMAPPTFESFNIDHYAPNATQVDFRWSHADINMGTNDFIIKKKIGNTYSNIFGTVVYNSGTQDFRMDNVSVGCADSSVSHNVKISIVAKDPLASGKSDSTEVLSTIFTCYSTVPAPTLNAFMIATPSQTQQGQYDFPLGFSHISAVKPVLTFNGFEAQYRKKGNGSSTWGSYVTVGNNFITQSGSSYTVKVTDTCPSGTQFQYRIRSKSTASGEESAWITGPTATCN
ncbi:MAG: fibronectin type III domain-containing protein [Bdellovibrionales bacterium]|nr:fibronectin type III domain-containing protein [Bdellovibrionales bacterium]